MNAVVAVQNRVGESRETARYSIEVAKNQSEIRLAQRLRYEVFAMEKGAEVKGESLGLDQDKYDKYSTHLLVWDSESGELAGCTRVLNDQQAALCGGFYSQDEFDLSKVVSLDGGRLEIGRTCISPKHREGGAISALWKGIAALQREGGQRYLMGCASIEWEENGAMAYAVVDRFKAKYGGTNPYKITPKTKLPKKRGCENVTAIRIPPLLKAYASLGAQIAPEPYFDKAFNCADMFVLVDTQNLQSRYAKRFWGQ